jgi:RimJ/RimL family protein N-acetyltransferase
MTEVELGCDRANVRSAALADRLGFILGDCCFKRP